MTNAWTIAVVGMGGALGAMARFVISAAFGTHHLFPWATLAINIAGAFAIGLLWGAYGTADWFQNWGRLFLVVGLLGGFTTFSAFSMETLNLLHADRYVSAVSYVTASVAACLVAAGIGEKAGQAWLT